MTDEEKSLLIEEFEDIPISSFSKRGLGSESIKDLNQNGIQIIGDLKGKYITQLSRRGREYLGKRLGEILCVIGIERGIESSYFLNYPFMSQYEEALNKMRLNPLDIPLERLQMNINIARILRGVGLVRIGDLIGKEYNEAKPSGMGEKRVKELEKALRMHNVVIKDGKFFWEPETVIKEENTDIGEPKKRTDRSQTAEIQLRELFVLSGKVATLDIDAIKEANRALRKIINDERGRGNG